MSDLVYVSVDIETDGPSPGANSMLSFGAVSYDETGEERDRFSVNFERISSLQNPDTMTWWKQFPRAWEAANKDPVSVPAGLDEIRRWLKSQSDAPVFVAYPSGFDFTFVYWYFMTWTKSCPFGFSAFDMQSYAAGKLGVPYNKAKMKDWPDEWKKDLPPHTHVAVEDAREQGTCFSRMLRWQK